MIIADTNLVVALVVTHPQRDSAAALYNNDPDWHLPDDTLSLDEALARYP